MEPETPYGASKLCEEKQCLAYAKLYDIEAVCLRYFNVYGPNQRFDAYGNVIPIFAFTDAPGRAADDLRRRRADARLRQRARRRAGEPEGGATPRRVRGLQPRQRHADHDQPPGRAACGTRAASSPRCAHGPPRPGDVRDSLADISAARQALRVTSRRSTLASGLRGVHGVGARRRSSERMKILVLGGEGMLGHKMFQTPACRGFPTRRCTIRGLPGRRRSTRIDLFPGAEVVERVDAMDRSPRSG